MTTTTVRTMTRFALAVLVAAVLAAAVVLGRTGLLTAALLAGVTAIGHHVRRTRAVAHARADGRNAGPSAAYTVMGGQPLRACASSACR